MGNLYPPQHVGGYELMWRAAIVHARERGHDVRILTSRYRRDGAAELDPGVHRELRSYGDPDRAPYPRLTPRARLALERANAATLHAHLRAFAPELISWWGMGTLSLSLIEQARRAGLPAQFVVHDDWLIYGPVVDQWLETWQRRPRLGALAQLALRLPTRVDPARCGPMVFNSARTRQRAVAAGRARADAAVVAPGIDAPGIDAPGIDGASAARPWGGRLLYVGRIDQTKGIDTAIRALSHLPEATLDVWGLGDDAYLAQCRALAAQLGVAERLHWRGWADPDARAAAYRDADAVVFPVRWEEPFGLVPLEAMAAGRPVLATGRGGSAEYLRDGDNALVFEAGEPAALAAAVQRLSADASLRERLREVGVATAREYTVERFARETVAAIEAAVRPRR